ncbi:hypothetical protein [Mycobacterium sp. NPDC050853]|uniref:hypothetical protein n=1 Tax=Mycobacterium sp. NPDC050853 TaxID=3155160 RepID=UPI0033FA8AA6
MIKVADRALILTQILQSKELYDELSKSIADAKAAAAVLEPLLHVPEVRSQYYQYSNDLTESVAKTIEALSGQIAEVSTDAQANKLVVSLQGLRANVARVAEEAHLPEPIADLPRREIQGVLERLAKIDATLDFRPEAQRLEKALSPVLDTTSGQLGYLSGLIEILNEAGMRLNRLATESDLADEMDALMNAVTRLSEQIDGLPHGVDDITDRT